MAPISIENELIAFKEHLDFNERTIFSAKFGDGKTFFLNEFKKKYSGEKKEDADEKEIYYFITLYPVNYSVAENQDIFEYIKRDILFQLAKDGKLNPIDFGAIAKSIFTWENLKEVICFLISCMPKGEILNKILEKGENFAKKYKEEQITFKEYESWFTSQKGGLYEHDGYTGIIIETLKYIKSLGYKTALIIEDLDRIDPAHLFRILNVLGAHIDEHIYNDSENTNKFGFDNIITVFDYNTTENIFHHFYGKDANYKGYINKFTSHQPFYYSINDIAHNYLYTYIYDQCHISYASLHNESTNEFIRKLDILSVRDIQKVLDDSGNQVINQLYTKSKLNFYTKGPLTILISILMNIGINIHSIKLFISNLNVEEKLNCINTFLCIHPNAVLNGVTIGGRYYISKHKKSKNDVITDVTISEIAMSSTMFEPLTHSQLDTCVNIAFRYIKGIKL